MKNLFDKLMSKIGYVPAKKRKIEIFIDCIGGQPLEYDIFKKILIDNNIIKP